jgi:hypothetical protein
VVPKARSWWLIPFGGTFMELWQIIALIVVIAGAIGFFVWKKKQGG